eukprot:15325596-Ditylum_brightwellii.AAC.1
MQKDIRDAVTDGGQVQRVRRKKTRRETTAGGDQQNAAEDKRDKGDTIKQTVMKDYYTLRDDTERAECQGAFTGQTT